MDIAALEEIAARLRSGANCADEAADLIDDAIAELERLHRSVMVEKQWRQDAGDDAKRYRWLRDHIGETPLNPRGFASEICPDTRLKWEVPKYGPDNPPRLRKPGESVEEYREAMGWGTTPPNAELTGRASAACEGPR